MVLRPESVRKCRAAVRHSTPITSRRPRYPRPHQSSRWAALHSSRDLAAATNTTSASLDENRAIKEMDLAVQAAGNCTGGSSRSSGSSSRLPNF